MINHHPKGTLMKSFSEQLPQIAGGAFEKELTDALADVLEYVTTHGGKPKITAEMELSTQLTKAGPMIKIAYRVSVKYPKEKPVDFSMFLSPEGNLLLDNPNQGKLPFAEVDGKRQAAEVVTDFSKKIQAVRINPEDGDNHD